MTFANMYGGVRTVKDDRNENDHYPTPPIATYALLKYHGAPRVIWEPAAGRGWMAWELARCHREVIATDLHTYDDPVFPVITGKDFFKCNEPAEGIITNPPYGKNLAQKFIEKSIKTHHYVAMLCRLTFAESDIRHSLFTNTPPTNILIFSSRFSCDQERWTTKKQMVSGMVAYAWWIWDRTTQHTGTLTSWIDTKSTYDEWSASLSSEQLSAFYNFLPKRGLENAAA